MFTRKMEQRCKNEFKARIDLPATNWFVRNENNVRFCCLNQGHIRYLVFPSRQHTAMFMLKNDLLKKVDVDGENVKMFREEYRYDFRRGSFTQHAVLREVKWEDITFTGEQVIEFFAQAELESIGGVVGICTAKVIPFTITPLLAA